MGLFDALNALRDANIAKHKASVAMSNARIKNIESASALADIIRSQIEGQPGTPGKMEFPNQKNIPAVSESTDLMSGNIKTNPSLAPVMTGATPAIPGKSMGDPLLDALVPNMIRSGNIKNIIPIVEHLNDPKRQFMKQVFSDSNVNMRPGQPAQPVAGPEAPVDPSAPLGMSMFAGIIQKAANGDPEALAMASKMKALGFDMAPFIERMQKANEPIKRQVYDSTTGLAYEYMATRQGGGKEIPGTRNLIKPEEVTWKSEALPGGGTQDVAYRGRTRLELNPPASPLAPQGTNATAPLSSPVREGPVLKVAPFNASFPPGTDTTPFINKLVAAGSGDGIITKLPETEMPITSEQIGNWFNQSFQNPPIGTTPKQAEKLGFKAHTANGSQIMGKTKQAIGIINQLEDLSKELFPESGLMNRLKGGAVAGYNLVTQDNPNYAIYSKLSQSVLGPLIRQLGEAGALSDGDVQRAFNIMGKLYPLPDSKTVALNSWQEIRKIVLKGTKFVEGSDIQTEQNRPSLGLGKSKVTSGKVIKITRDAKGNLVETVQ